MSMFVFKDMGMSVTVFFSSLRLSFQSYIKSDAIPALGRLVLKPYEAESAAVFSVKLDFIHLFMIMPAINQ